MEGTVLRFELGAASRLRANQLADSLKPLLEEIGEDVRVDRPKENVHTLELGSVLVAVVGSKFALELGKVLHAWVVKNSDAQLTIKKDGEIIVKNVRPDQIESILKKALAVRK